ncbi:MAG: MFS transporter [Alistipes sp.]|nr:MFS transporter [Candidatus Alistipes equi]
MIDEYPKLWNRNYITVWIANFLLHFSFMLLTPLLPLYLNDTFGADKEAIGVVLSGYIIAALIARLFSGYIVDNFPRKLVLLVCYFFFFLFFAGYIIAGSLTLFAIVRTLHGAPFGFVTVASSTIAIDVLDSRRRAEGIGYYGLSNNLAMAIGPTFAIFLHQIFNSYNLLFVIALIFSAIGLGLDATIKLKTRETIERKKISLDRFILIKGWSQGLCMVCFAFSYGILSTYLAIYGRDTLGITTGTGTFFTLLAIGLICSRLVGSRSLRKGKIAQNATMGVLISVLGYLLFAAVPNSIGYYGAAIIIGLGNGHMYPAFQNMFINLAENSQRGTANSTILTSWDVGIGFGVLGGGFVAENFGYSSTFWIAWIGNIIGVIFFLSYARGNFIKNKLR